MVQWTYDFLEQYTQQVVYILQSLTHNIQYIQNTSQKLPDFPEIMWLATTEDIYC